jgi:hypothetical protein
VGERRVIPGTLQFVLFYLFSTNFDRFLFFFKKKSGSWTSRGHAFTHPTPHYLKDSVCLFFNCYFSFKMSHIEKIMISAEIVLDRSKTTVAPPPRPRPATTSLSASPVRPQPTVSGDRKLRIKKQTRAELGVQTRPRTRPRL